MRTIKLTVAAALAAIGLAVAQAGQPVVQTLVWTNSILKASGLTASTSPVFPTVFALQSGAVVTNLDTELQTQFNVVATLPAVAQGTDGGTAQGFFTFYTQVSPDNVTWTPGPNIAVAVTTTNGPNTLLTNISSTTFRFLQITNINSSSSNCAVYQSNGPVFKVFWKAL